MNYSLKQKARAVALFTMRTVAATLIVSMATSGVLQAQTAVSAPMITTAPTTSGTAPGDNGLKLQPTNQIPRYQNGTQGSNGYDQSRYEVVAPQENSSATAPAHPPTEFQRIVASSTGRMLPIFGSNLFSGVPSTFSPVDNIPVTPDYTVGPGDEVLLQMWGQVNQSGSYVVDRTGMIYIPSVGPVHVAGVRFAQLREFLRSQLGRVYRNFDLNVNLGQLRSIQVFVVGQASKPGSYTIGSLSTLLNALFASGGPLPQGSLRDIQVRRGGTTVTHFDLYDLLLHGDKSKDVPLQSGDVIYIPTVGPQVAVLGSVASSAVYELHGETSFDKVIELAGGKTNVAAGSLVRVERISGHAERSVTNVDLDSAVLKDTPVQDGDIVTVSPIIDRFKNAVTLRGNVVNPGRYPWTPGMRISDLIPNQDALVTRNYYEKTNALAQSNMDYSGQTEGALGVATDTTRNANAAQIGAGNNQQNPNAANPNGNSNSTNASTQSAPVRTTPGMRGSVGEAMTAHSDLFDAKTDVILQAPDIDWDYAVIERQNKQDLTTALIPFNLGKVVLEHDASQNLELQQGDIITIFSKADIRVPSLQQTRFVRLEGEFIGAGVYSVQPGETLRQLIARAGGLTVDAYLYGSEFTRKSTQRVQKQRLEEYADSLDAQISTQTANAVASAQNSQDTTAAQTDADIARSIVTRLRQTEPPGRIVLEMKPDSQGLQAIPDIALEDGDRFVVPKVPSNVSVEGQVYNSNAFLWKKGKRVKNYLEMAGGPDRSADKRRAFLLHADGSVLSSQYGDFKRALMYPGDTIVVPPTVQHSNLLRDIANISTILVGFGVAAAAIQVLH